MHCITYGKAECSKGAQTNFTIKPRALKHTTRTD
jgi:hypothetical protein